jgi:diacylglycerol kinase family enzyme
VVTVLVNPGAGGGKPGALPEKIAAAFTEAGAAARVVVVHRAGDMDREVEAAIAAGSAAVVAAGGDGTVSSVAAAVLGTRIPLGILPLGTLNHFSKDLGLPQDLAEAVRVIVAGRTAGVDVGEVNGRIFLNNSSIGIYPDIVMEREALRQQGHRKWIAFGIATARVISRYPGVYVSLRVGATPRVHRTPFVFVGNNEYLAEGIRLGKRPRMDGGVLSAYLAPRLHARDLPRLAFRALLGRVRHDPSFESFTAESLEVATFGRRLRVALDGEVTLLTSPLRYRSHPAALEVITPAPDGNLES